MSTQTNDRLTAPEGNGSGGCFRLECWFDELASIPPDAWKRIAEYYSAPERAAERALVWGEWER